MFFLQIWLQGRLKDAKIFTLKRCDRPTLGCQIARLFSVVSALLAGARGSLRFVAFGYTYQIELSFNAERKITLGNAAE